MAEGFFIVRLNTGGAMAKVPHPAPPRTHPPKPALQSTNDVVPSPVEQMTGAEAVVRALEEVGTEVVFGIPGGAILPVYDPLRSEEHTSELQSRGHLVCRLLLEKKKRKREHTGGPSTRKTKGHETDTIDRS